MKPVSTLFVLFLFSIAVSAQNFSSSTSGFHYPTNVQLELGGHGGFYSINAEHFIFNSANYKTGLQIGFAYYPENTEIINVWLPVGVTQLFSLNSSHLEIGIGHILGADKTVDGPSTDPEIVWERYINGRIGYRYQKTNGQFLLRASF
ncbi:MAG: hypothetical protein HKO56_01075, partial [Bacteroidia bacterium]|nr:hypothetical protein [Bacteroidia bacterium]